MRGVSAWNGSLIVTGDLNMAAGLAHRVTGPQPLTTQLTFPAESPQRQLDHVLARGIPAAVAGQAVRLPLSDHLALAVDLPTD
ncbi:MAG: hypothetical protein H0T14_08535 [Nocardioidaceae bacterium]|nr:hypothetical protein [Nocardioidaceae bacterium]